jgi:hypothetical protein
MPNERTYETIRRQISVGESGEDGWLRCGDGGDSL